MLRYLSLILLTGCLGEETLEWYEGPCGNGDPVGISCVDEDDTVWEDASTDLCDDLEVAAGDTCATDGGTCVLMQAFTCASGEPAGRSSEYLLTCLEEEPIDDDQCPQSSRSSKRDISYVDPAQRKQIAKEVLDVKLARYHYRDPAKAGEKLGYILEDHPTATFSGDGRVDLYAYMSAVVALTQEQQAEIEALKAEIEALKTK